MQRPGRRRELLLPAALSLHLVVAAVHGATHGLVPVELPAWQNVVVLATTFLGPTLGVILDRRGHRLGLGVFTASMLSAFLLGVVLHFVVESPDHVHAVPADPWRVPFQVTAVAVAVTPALGTAAGLWVSRQRAVA